MTLTKEQKEYLERPYPDKEWKLVEEPFAQGKAKGIFLSVKDINLERFKKKTDE